MLLCKRLNINIFARLYIRFESVDHVNHIRRVAGIDYVGIGGDYDGVESFPIGLEDVSKVHRVLWVWISSGTWWPLLSSSILVSKPRRGNHWRRLHRVDRRGPGQAHQREHHSRFQGNWFKTSFTQVFFVVENCSHILYFDIMTLKTKLKTEKPGSNMRPAEKRKR